MTTSASATTRRTVLAAGAVVGAVVLVPGAVRALGEQLTPVASAEVRRADFARHLGQRFDAVVDGTRARLVLERVEDLSDDLTDDERSFAVRFTADGDLPGGSYELSRPGFASQPVLLVAGRRDGAPGLTAVYHRWEARG